MISPRTMACLFEVISDIDVAHTVAILQGIDVDIYDLQWFIEPAPCYKVQLKNIFFRLDAGGRNRICADVISLRDTIRTLTNSEFKFDERWTRLERSLRLDGYTIFGGTIKSEDPIADQLITMEDSLAALIHQTRVPQASDIVTLMKNSAEDFMKLPPDYNGCLSNIRTVLETLPKSLAASVQSKCGENKDTSKWRNAISYLKGKTFLSEKEEQTLISIYSLLSEQHRPVLITEEEMVHFARTLSLSGCWLLAKKGINLTH